MDPSTGLDRPALRAVSCERGEQGGQVGLVLEDPHGIGLGPTFIPGGLVAILAKLDGSRTIAQVEQELAAEHGQALPAGIVARVVQQLDERYLLQSSRYFLAAEELTHNFLATGVRMARHAGSAGYPADRAQLHQHLQGIATCQPASQPTPRGLIAPHIDLARGRDGYRLAYGRLAPCRAADLYVVFGTGHKGPSSPLVGLNMDWHTPLGQIPTDHEFVAAVHDRIGATDPLDLLLHRDEHSIEFQMLFLRHLYPDQEFKVAGFLTGALPSSCGDPGHEEYMQRILATFRELAAASGKRVCYVAGADLAHLGPFFGDPEAMDSAQLERLRRADLARLEQLLTAGPGIFHQAVHEDGNADRICGSAPVFLTAALAGGEAELLHYGQAAADDGSQVVSYCSVIYT